VQLLQREMCFLPMRSDVQVERVERMTEMVCGEGENELIVAARRTLQGCYGAIMTCTKLAVMACA
jgi:hypothetical protein